MLSACALEPAPPALFDTIQTLALALSSRSLTLVGEPLALIRKALALVG